jgi:hypothetical protein
MAFAATASKRGAFADMNKAAIDIGKALARLSDLTIFELRGEWRHRSNLGSSAPRFRTNGQAAGSAFAQISEADYNRASDFARAIRSGV